MQVTSAVRGRSSSVDHGARGESLAYRRSESPEGSATVL